MTQLPACCFLSAFSWGWNWLTEIQTLGTPDMMLSWLIQHHNAVEKHMIFRHNKQVPKKGVYTGHFGGIVFDFLAFYVG